MVELEQLTIHNGFFSHLWDSIVYFAGRIEPVWQISIIALLCFSVILFLILYLIDRIKLTQMVALSIIPSYILFILVLTIFIRLPNPEVYYEIVPLWSYIEIFKNHRLDIIIDNLFNLAIFLPLGFIFMCSPGAKTRESKWKAFKIMLVITIAFSLIIELIQLISRHGCCETDDIINNLIGAATGGLLYMFFTYFTNKKDYATEDKIV